jgi:uroporphyrinogen decarboxylase
MAATLPSATAETAAGQGTPAVLRGARMTARERVLTALRREVPDRVPRDMEWTPPARDALNAHLGGVSPEDAFGLEVRTVAPRRAWSIETLRTRFDRYFGAHNLPAGVTVETMLVDEWGLGEVPHPEVHYTQYVHPLAGVESADEIERYPWPDRDAPYRWAGMHERVASLHARGLAVAGSAACSVFERAWYLRGMDNLFADWAENEPLATALLDRITQSTCAIARCYAEAGVDVLQLGDDIGTQRGVLMSVPMWRRWLKPRLARIIAAAREVRPDGRDLIIWYHSDGFVEPFIPELIEIGVQVLNPVQPECMDPVQLKREFGDRLAFWGAMGTQTTLPFGTPDDVRAVVRERIETLGQRGGFLLAPTHVVQPDVPWQNVRAFFDAVDEFGVYD